MVVMPCIYTQNRVVSCVDILICFVDPSRSVDGGVEGPEDQ